MWFLGSCSFHAPESTYAGQAITKSNEFEKAFGRQSVSAHWDQGAGVRNESPAHWDQGAGVWNESPAREQVFGTVLHPEFVCRETVCAMLLVVSHLGAPPSATQTLQ